MGQQIFEARADHILLYKAKISLKLGVSFLVETIRMTKWSCLTKVTTYGYKRNKTRLDKNSRFSWGHGNLRNTSASHSISAKVCTVILLTEITAVRGSWNHRSTDSFRLEKISKDHWVQPLTKLHLVNQPRALSATSSCFNWKRNILLFLEQLQSNSASTVMSWSSPRLFVHWKICFRLIT